MTKDTRDRRAYHKEYYKRLKVEHEQNPEKRSARFIKYNYGLSWEEYKNLEVKQNYVCAICKQPETVRRLKRLSVDHNHITGKIRGLLCVNCNNGLGRFKDSPELLLKAYEYLHTGL